MSKENLTIRVEPEIKEQASALFKSLGLDLSTATNIFYHQAIQHNGIPFEVKNEEPNEITYKVLKEAEDDENLYGPFKTVNELMEELNA